METEENILGWEKKNRTKAWKGGKLIQRTMGSLILWKHSVSWGRRRDKSSKVVLGHNLKTHQVQAKKFTWQVIKSLKRFGFRLETVTSLETSSCGRWSKVARCAMGGRGEKTRKVESSWFVRYKGGWEKKKIIKKNTFT